MGGAISSRCGRWEGLYQAGVAGGSGYIKQVWQVGGAISSRCGRWEGLYQAGVAGGRGYIKQVW